jgi:beta-N-acetylhexosaminidase
MLRPIHEGSLHVIPHIGRLAAIILVAMALPANALAEVSIEQMAGQMIIVGFAGNSVAKTEALRAEIAAGELGGIMYLKTNISDLDTVKAMNEAFLAANPALPPFTTVDQEGGLVERLTKDVGFPETPSAADIAASMDDVDAGKEYRRMARDLAEVGFNVNFGPVADMNVNPNNPVIARFGRSYGSNAIKVMAYNSAFMNAHHAEGVLTALKHFPGHGSSTTDSHEGFVDISKTWESFELTPYKQLIQRGAPVDMVMVGHLYVGDHGDGADVPSSLSRYWITDVLRGEIGFAGVVITDDMEMGAVLDHFPLEDRIVRAVNAGVDILLFSNTARPRASIADDIRAILVKHAHADPAFAAKIVASYGRIVTLKQKLKR